MCAEKRTAPSEKLSMLVYRFPSISGRRLKRRFRKVKATEAIRSNNLLDNAAIAELLIREAETASGHRRLALRRAAREAFMWPEEAVHIASAGRSLTELQGIGPTLARHLNGWFESPPSILAKNREGKRLLQGYRAISRCTRFGVTAAARFQQWPRPR